MAALEKNVKKEENKVTVGHGEDGVLGTNAKAFSGPQSQLSCHTVDKPHGLVIIHGPDVKAAHRN